MTKNFKKSAHILANLHDIILFVKVQKHNKKTDVYIMKNNLQKLRWNKQWSQEQLAIYSGVNRSLIGKIENRDVKNPSVFTALLLAKSLGVTVEDLFTIV